MKTFATIFRPINELIGDDDDPTMTDVVRRDSAPRTVDPLTPASTAAVGPRYAVRDILGRGGMGEVRLCRDDRIGRDVAVKVALSGAAMSRFLREARVQGQLEHPSIVPVHDLEILDDGSAYFVMKRVRGKTLAAVLKEDSLPLRKLLAAFTSICLAVELAHNKGVVHRDIKPGNVMLGDFGEVYLLDWGLAKIKGAADDDDATALSAAAPAISAAAGATEAGALLGTPGYMSPEQIDPSVGPVGPASDIYGLGAVLFEIVARSPYIEAEDSLDATLKTLKGVEARPTVRAPSRHVPPALDVICAKALAREPKDRYASARELHDAVDAFLAGEQEQAQRHAMSKLHLDAAEKAITGDKRSEALAELGRAIAVDPGNEAARASLLKLLTSPPPTTPPEVKARIKSDIDAQARQIAFYTALTTLPFFLLTPFAIAIGVRSWTLFAASEIPIFVALVINIALARSKAPSLPWQYAGVTFLFLGQIALTKLAGPVGMLPALLVAFAAGRQSHPDKWHRRYCTVLGCAVAVIGLLYELADPQYFVRDDGIFVKDGLIVLDERALFFFVLCTLVTIIGPAVTLARTRLALANAEASLHVQRWQLEQLVR